MTKEAQATTTPAPVYERVGDMIKRTIGDQVAWIPMDTGNQHYRDYLASLEQIA